MGTVCSCEMGNDDAAAARHRAANAATSGPPPGVSAEEWGSLSKSEQKRRLKQTEKEMKAAKKKGSEKQCPGCKVEGCGGRGGARSNHVLQKPPGQGKSVASVRFIPSQPERACHTC